MTMTDLDPTFIKALRLLHSKSKDSADQLKQMLDDVLHSKKGQKVFKKQDLEISMLNAWYMYYTVYS